MLPASVSEIHQKFLLKWLVGRHQTLEIQAQGLALRTDSSQRFEKSLDPKLCIHALAKIIELIKKLNPDSKIVGGLNYDGVKSRLG